MEQLLYLWMMMKINGKLLKKFTNTQVDFYCFFFDKMK
jgi:hypothetical protein